MIRVYPGGRIRTATAIHQVEAYVPPGKESGGYVITDEGLVFWDRDFTVLKHLPDLCDVKKEKREEWSRHRYQLIRTLHKKKRM